MPTWSWGAWLGLSLAFFTMVTALLDFLCRAFLKHFLISPEKRQRQPVNRLKAVMFFLANTVQIGAAVYLATIAFHHGYSGLRTQRTWGSGDILQLTLEVFLILLIQDTNFYWFHRLGHLNKKIYTTLHADHHVSRYPNAWMLQYQNPFDYFLTTAAPLFWIVLLPIPFSTTAYFVAVVVANFLNIAGHLGYEVSNTFIGLPSFNGWAARIDPSRKWIAKIFTNVLHHDLHHQKVVNNYSLYFTLWDRLCGTLHPDTDRYVSEFSDTRGLEARTDFVVSYDVIEHFEDPRQCMQTLRDATAPGGFIVIGTPNGKRTNLNKEAEYMVELSQPYHRHILSDDLLIQMAAQNGCEFRSITHRFYLDTLVPFVNTRFAWAYLRKMGNHLDTAAEGLRISNVLGSPRLLLFAFFGYLLPVRSNFVAVFHRPV